MNEVDFRDWARAQLRAMDQKLERLAQSQATPPRIEPDERIRGDMAALVETVARKLKARELAGLAIAFVNAEGKAMAGYAATACYFQLAGAASFVGVELLDEFRRSEAANDDERKAAS
jgi:hypothetical protein